MNTMITIFPLLRATSLLMFLLTVFLICSLSWWAQLFFSSHFHWGYTFCECSSSVRVFHVWLSNITQNPDLLISFCLRQWSCDFLMQVPPVGQSWPFYHTLSVSNYYIDFLPLWRFPLFSFKFNKHLKRFFLWFILHLVFHGERAFRISDSHTQSFPCFLFLSTQPKNEQLFHFANAFYRCLKLADHTRRQERFWNNSFSVN